MRGRKNKRMLAILAAVVMLVSTCLSGIPAVTAQAADYTVLETDVSTASSGCTMLGVLGTYYVDAQKALDRINEIRKEACNAGNVPDPRKSSRMLTSSDYVEIKWSTDLERIARIRAMENGLSYYFVGKYHYRMNEKEVFTVSYNGLSSSGEVLAWNSTKGDYVYGINQWYAEKTNWVNQNTSAVTGHYEMMINPDNTYVGLGDFYSTECAYENTLAGEFSKISKTLDGTYLDGSSDIMQKVEVSDKYIDSYYLEGENSQAIGTTQTLTPRALLKNNSYERNLYVVEGVTYTSSDSTVAEVSPDGVVTAKAKGSVTITATLNGTSIATKTISVGCVHNKVLQSTVAATCQKEGKNIYKCSKCGEEIVETTSKAEHAYVYGTAGSDGTATGTCSVCGNTITIAPPTAYTLYWRNSTSDDDYYYTDVPSTGNNPVGSSVNCWVHDMTGGGNDYTDIMFESSDNSILSVPTTGVSLQNIAKFTVKKAGIVTVTAYPKYNPSLKKTYTIRTGDSGSVSIEDAYVKLSADSASCNASTYNLSTTIVPTVIWNGVTLTKGTDYTVSYAKTDTDTGICTITGKGVFKDSIEVTYSLTHTYKLDSETDATCTKEGTKTYKCSGCGDTYTESVDKNAHSYTAKTVSADTQKSAATCTKPAVYYYSCASCGAVNKAEEAETFTNGKATGHSYEVEVTTAATCTKEGVKTYTCSVCGNTYTESLLKLAHNYTAKTVKGEALKSESDCVNPARYYYSCSVCGAVNDAENAETFEYGTATTHNYNTKRTEDKYLCAAATCTQPATYYYSCSGCGEIADTNPETFESGEPNGHNYTAKNTASVYLKSAATTSSPAIYYYSCSTCGTKGNATFTSGSALAKDTGTSGAGTTTAKDITVSYKTHIQTYGDTQSVKTNGQMAGTSGEAKRLENIWIKVSGDSNLGIQYTTHCQTYGWLPWSTNGEANGTSGEAKRLEAIKIRLTGADANLYDVYYRVHAQSFGWLAWAKNGEPSGTAGYAKRLEGIQIVVVKKGTAAPGLNYAGVNASQTAHDTRAYVSQSNTAIVIPGSDSTVNVMYKTHVQSYGWQTWKENGEMSGTSGKAKRLEGINIKLSNAPYSGGIRYTTHVQTYGWQGNENNPATWKQDGAMAGTSGEAKRLEAIRIALYGEMAEHYDVYYRVHAQTYGWLGWAKNGAASGTAGYAKRLEGIQIVLVPKGEAAPSNTYMGITSTNALPYISK